VFEESDLLSKDGYDYRFTPSACASCGGACCTGESGYIWVKYKEMEEMAKFLDLTIEEFASTYLKKVKHRYSLIEKRIDIDNYACIFFDTTKKICTIYSVRPMQCRTFPFWEVFKNRKEEVKKECLGIRD
jgi:Fe-S-cluster containining protein